MDFKHNFKKLTFGRILFLFFIEKLKSKFKIQKSKSLEVKSKKGRSQGCHYFLVGHPPKVKKKVILTNQYESISSLLLDPFDCKSSLN